MEAVQLEAFRFADVQSGAQLVVHALLCEAADGACCGDPLCTPRVAAMKLAFRDLEAHVHACSVIANGGVCAMCAQWKSLLRTKERHRSNRQCVQRAPTACRQPGAELTSAWALPAASPPPAALEAPAEEWPAWLGEDQVLDALATLLDEEISPAQSDGSSGEPTLGCRRASQPVPPEAPLPHCTHTQKRRRTTGAPSLPEAPAAAAVATVGPAAAAATVEAVAPAAAAAAAAATVEPATSNHGQQLPAAVPGKLPPALFNQSEAMTEFRAAYRAYRMGAARGVAGEQPEDEAPSAKGGGAGAIASSSGEPSSADAASGSRARGHAPGGGSSSSSAALSRLAEAVRLLPDVSLLLLPNFLPPTSYFELTGTGTPAARLFGAAASSSRTTPHPHPPDLAGAPAARLFGAAAGRLSAALRRVALGQCGRRQGRDGRGGSHRRRQAAAAGVGAGDLDNC